MNETQATLSSPPGYGPVEPLDKVKHAGRGLRADRTEAWCAGVNAVYVSAAEFPRAALDYPVAFAREPATDLPLPLAILGLQANQNLFVGADGRWRPHAYVPAYVRRYPFCIAEAPGEKEGESRRLVCLQADQLVEGSEPFFNADGSPTPAWQPVQGLLEAMEGAREQTSALMRRIDSLKLLVPFDALALPRGGGQQMRLQGLMRVDEARLAALSAGEVRGLLTRGDLRLIFAHLLSLENFARLLDLAHERTPATPKS